MPDAALHKQILSPTRGLQNLKEPEERREGRGEATLSIYEHVCSSLGNRSCLKFIHTPTHVHTHTHTHTHAHTHSYIHIHAQAAKSDQLSIESSDREIEL